MKKSILLASLGLLLSQQCLAEEVPHAGSRDNRVRFVDFHPSEVYRVNAQYGIATNIIFSSEVTNVVIGDPNAWEVAKVDNRLFIRPLEDDPGTNMTVVTQDQKSHNFWLSSRIPRTDNNLNNTMFQISFRYPEDERQERLREREQDRIENALDEAGTRARNWLYYVKGSEDLSPVYAYDDGRFTYLTFLKNQDMPAVFIEDENGEYTPNTHVEDNTIVIEEVAEKIVLRYGNKVACVFNEGPASYDDALPDSRTVSPHVERRVRSVQ